MLFGRPAAAGASILQPTPCRAVLPYGRWFLAFPGTSPLAFLSSSLLMLSFRSLFGFPSCFSHEYLLECFFPSQAWSSFCSISGSSPSYVHLLPCCIVPHYAGYMSVLFIQGWGRASFGVAWSDYKSAGWPAAASSSSYHRFDVVGIESFLPISFESVLGSKQ